MVRYKAPQPRPDQLKRKYNPPAMKKTFGALWLISFVLIPTAWAHYHCNVGALSQAQGSPLYFQNGGSFATNTGFVLTLDLDTDPDPYAGNFSTSDVNNLSFTSIGQGFFDNPADGAQVRLRFVSVSGPPGGSIGVWDVANFFSGDDFNSEGNDATAIAFSLPAGTSNGTNSILLSENHGTPGADPYGHIHGRQLSATKPGLYVVTVQAYDNSHNGTDGGPVQSPSSLLSIYFQAGSEISALIIGTNQVAISFPSQLGTDYYLQVSTNPAVTGSWHTIDGPISGSDSFQAFTESGSTAIPQFYRLLLSPTP